jgi:hypothetical protein
MQPLNTARSSRQLTFVRFVEMARGPTPLRAVSRFFEKGLNMPEIAAISGHRDPRMLMRYTHPKAEAIAVKL